jgi:hypothetical protein
MSEVLRKAVEDARTYEAQSDQLAQMLAVIQALQLTQHVQQSSGCQCSHAPERKPRRSAGSMVAMAGAVCVCGAVLTAMFLAVTLVAVSVSVGALAVMWLVREVRAQNDRR